MPAQLCNSLSMDTMFIVLLPQKLDQFDLLGQVYGRKGGQQCQKVPKWDHHVTRTVRETRFLAPQSCIIESICKSSLLDG